MSEPDDSYFMAFDTYLKIVELMSGVRQKLIEQGCSEHNAEIITIHLMFGVLSKK